jgi:hypothetical protein
MILLEGGNAFPDVEPFDHSEIKTILATVNKTLSPTGARAIPIGSGATPVKGKQSGDLDVIVDQAALADHYNIKDPKSLRKALRADFDAAGLQTAQSGISVHVRVPVGKSAHQVDIMVVPNAENTAKFHTHDIPQDSPYKGLNKQLAMAYLAKKKNMLWSAFQGLFARDDKGKKADLVTDNIDEIAKLLIGPNARAKDLGSVESIMSALDPQEAEQMISDLKADPSWRERKTESVELVRIKQLSGLV